MALDSLTILIPFLFILAIIWGGLEVSGVFKNKGVKALISLVIAFFAITTEPIVLFINQILFFAVVFFVIIFFVVFLKKLGKSSDIDWSLLAVMAALVLILLFSLGTEFLGTIFPGASQISQDNILAGIGIITLILILFSAYQKWSEK